MGQEVAGDCGPKRVPDGLLKCNMHFATYAQVQFDAIPDDVVDQLVADKAMYSCAGGLMVEHPLLAPLITAQYGEQVCFAELFFPFSLCIVDDRLW